MQKKSFLLNLFVIILVMAFSGCSLVTETAKTIWGSSTRALENARIDADKKIFSCKLEDCFQTVLGLTIEDETLDPPLESEFDLFIKNRKKKHIVVMGVPGSVNTTEVGIFFLPLDDTQIEVQISSLSSNAKATVSQKVFQELSSKYNVVQ